MHAALEKMTGAGRGRPRQQTPSGIFTPGHTRRQCAIERAPTPGGTARSPVAFMQECTPADEARCARKQRLDRNRQAARYAAVKAARSAKAKPTALDFERRIVDAVDKEQPERSFDMELLDDIIMMSHRSKLKDRRDAAAMLRDGENDVESRIAAAVHLMVGPTRYHKWTRTGKERMACDVCGRRFALRADGLLRTHSCSKK